MPNSSAAKTPLGRKRIVPDPIPPRPFAIGQRVALAEHCGYDSTWRWGGPGAAARAGNVIDYGYRDFVHVALDVPATVTTRDTRTGAPRPTPISEVGVLAQHLVALDPPTTQTTQRRYP